MKYLRRSGLLFKNVSLEIVNHSQYNAVTKNNFRYFIVKRGALSF